MPSLKEVKMRINSVISTQQITKAMKMVAAAKLRKSQDRIIQMRPFAQKMAAILQNLSAAGQQDTSASWYSMQREVNKVLLVVVTSDRGLCGSFNSNIFKATLRVIEEQYASLHKKGNLTILPVGKKALDYFSKRKYPVVADYALLFSKLNFDEASRAADYLMENFRNGTYDRIDIIYNEFKNVATQIIRTEQYLPVVPKISQSKMQVDYIYQPDSAAVLEGIIPKSLRVQLFKALLDSNAAENGARMTAMDKATENAGELLKELRLSYNRTRQAAITKEILEIVGGAEALKSS
ncbi:MAG: ATP synthase F1 subunit gamma [Cyclobacteriaceae bacterium]|nr:ATP synthase F1 subunit gamma [Cyclobacteriaceae bacterium]MDW8330601.1 ATP synthase F1 subunit gamma [Cyclobacteriaceae bacterium]